MITRLRLNQNDTNIKQIRTGTTNNQRSFNNDQRNDNNMRNFKK